MDFDPVTGPPSGGAQPGAIALMEYVLAKWPRLINSGIYNPRDVCGNLWGKTKCGFSPHLEGRACDFGVRPYKDPLGREVAMWLVDHADAYGIQEVIWDEQRWSWPLGVWKFYDGRSKHHDHVHTTLTRDAAQNLTTTQLFTHDQNGPVAVPLPINEEDNDMAKLLLRSDDGYWAINGDHMYPIRDGQSLQTHYEMGFTEGSTGITADQITWMRKAYDVDEQRIVVEGLIYKPELFS